MIIIIASSCVQRVHKIIKIAGGEFLKPDTGDASRERCAVIGLKNSDARNVEMFVLRNKFPVRHEAVFSKRRQAGDP